MTGASMATGQPRMGAADIWREWRPVALGALVVLAVAALPLAGLPGDVLTLLFFIALSVTLGQSWNLLGGFVGQVNLGHAAFFGVGSLVTRQLWLATNLPFALAFIAGGLAALLFGLVIGLPTFRLRGAYFSMGTLGLAEALRLTVGNVLPGFNVLGGKVTAEYDLVSRYELGVILAAVACLVAHLARTSRRGLGLLAVREDEEAARASGVNPLRHKLGALALSSFFAGLAGALYAFYQASYYMQSVFDPSWTFDSIIITYVGGVGTVLGPVVGAIFYVVVRDRLALSFSQLHQVLFGVLFILVVLLLPGGFIDLWSRRLTRWPRLTRMRGDRRTQP